MRTKELVTWEVYKTKYLNIKKWEIPCNRVQPYRHENNVFSILLKWHVRARRPHLAHDLCLLADHALAKAFRATPPWLLPNLRHA